MPDARFKHPNRSAAVWLVPVYNPVGTKKPRLGFSILLHVAYRIYTKLSLSSGTGTGGSKKDGDFPGVWGFSPSDRSLSIHTWLKKGKRYHVDQVQNWWFLVCKLTQSRQDGGFQSNFLDLELCWLTIVLQSTSYFFEVPIAASQDEGIEIKFRSGGESQWFVYTFVLFLKERHEGNT